MRVVVVLALALGLAPAASATHPGWFFNARMNLDSDSAREHLYASHLTHPDEARVSVVDTCRGSDVRHELAAPGIYMLRGSIHGSRDLGRPGVLFSIHYADGHTIGRIARLRIQHTGECPTPVSLFDYSTDSPPRPAPRGFVLQDFVIRVHDYSGQYSGPELRLDEFYGEVSPGPVLSTRYTYFRYSVRSRSYAEYRSVLKPV
jgi:hypothetical protein